MKYSIKKIVIGTIVLLVLILILRVNNLFGEKFNDIKSEKDETKNGEKDEYIKPGVIVNYLKLKSDKEESENMCPNIGEGVCANLKTEYCKNTDGSYKDDDESSKDINNSIKKCLSKNDEYQNIMQKTGKYVYNNTFPRINTGIQEIQTGLDDLAVSSDNLINQT